MINKNKSFRLIIQLLCFITLISHWNVETSVLTDITGSRNRYLSGDGDSFLGGISAVFYGNLPDNVFRWWQYLLIIQTLAASIGTYFLFAKKINDFNTRKFLLVIFFSYLSINLAVGQSRDGLMISGTLLSLGIIARYPKNRFSIWISCLVYIFVFSLRPWLAVSLFPLFYIKIRKYFLLTKLKTILVSIILIALPVCVEVSVSNIWSIKPGYAQQAVMIHDLSSTYCLSSTQNTRNVAYSALSKLSNNPESLKYLCNFYKPNTWQSTSTKNLSDPIIADFEPPISPIQPGDDYNYNNLQSSWIKLIILDPKTYIQNHLFFLTQVLFGGDSTSIGFRESFTLVTQEFGTRNLVDFFSTIYDIPWKLTVMSYLLTPITIFALVFFCYWKKFRRDGITHFLELNLTFLIWIGLTTIGFVSDNGRYTYLPALLIISNLLREGPVNKKIRNK
jgi:hypothetical protein